VNVEKQLPSNIEAERAVLGSILQDRDAILMVVDRLIPAQFYLPKHAWIFEAMLNCHRKNVPADLQMVGNELRIAGRLLEVGDVTFLAQLADSVSTAYHIEYYAKPIEDTAILRRLVQAGGKIAAMAYDEAFPVDEVLGNCYQEIAAIRTSTSGGDLTPVSEAVDELYQEWESGVVPGTLTDIGDLDQFFGGWRPGNLVILGARPSIGKSALAAQIAFNIAGRGERVLFLSIEMPRKQIVQRLVCQSTGYDLDLLTRHQFADGVLPRLLDAAGKIAEMPLMIKEKGSFTMDTIRSVVMKDIASHGTPSMIILDYLQRAKGSGKYNGNRNNEVGDVSASLKALSMEAKCPVLALAALGRAIESRADHAPNLADLRESGDIEFDADIVMFIHRQERYDKNSDQKGVAEIHIAKNRNGPVGFVALNFDTSSQRWRNLVQYHTPAGYGGPQ
jgi:replicative DNA helicase